MSSESVNYITAAKEELSRKYGISNPHAASGIEKVVINVGYGWQKNDRDFADSLFSSLQTITGQKPVFTRAKKSIASFKLRAGEPIGIKLTLRNKKMFDFIYKLVKVVLPAIRDFRGLSQSGFDSQGNYTLGLKDITVFPEIAFSQNISSTGCQITVVIRGAKEHKKSWLEFLGFPFNKES